MFCEADGDHRTAAALIDEALSLRCAPWVRERLDATPESVRVWHEAPEARRPWFDVHHVYDIARRLGVKVPSGRFGGVPAAPGALSSGIVLVLGCPDPIRETWVLAGFEPESDDERRRLEAERRSLGFHPNEEPHRLTAGDEHALEHAKRVLRALGVTTWERERACLRIADDARRARLRVRGAGCGLDAFLGAVEAELAPRVDPGARL